MTMLHRIEGYNNSSIRISFDTKYHGYWMCEWTPTGMRELPSQKPFHVLKGKEQKRIEELAPVVYYFTFGELPKGLQAQIS